MANKTNDNGVDRDMTADEEAVYLVYQQKSQAQAEAQAETLEAKAATRQAALDKFTELGLTADEVAALFG